MKRVEVDANTIPAVDGKHKRFVAPTPPGRDPWTKALCTSEFMCSPICPGCAPERYTAHAKHRADVAA